MKHIILFVLLSFISISTSFSQKSFIINNITIHTGNGKVIENGYIAVKNGKIAELSSDSKMPKGYELTYDGKGQHIYPSFIASNTQLGLGSW